MGEHYCCSQEKQGSHLPWAGAALCFHQARKTRLGRRSCDHSLRTGGVALAAETGVWAVVVGLLVVMVGTAKQNGLCECGRGGRRGGELSPHSPFPSLHISTPGAVPDGLGASVLPLARKAALPQHSGAGVSLCPSLWP